MKKNSIFLSLPFKLLVGVIAGVLVGLLLSSTDGNAFSRAILNIVAVSYTHLTLPTKLEV